MSPIQRNQAFVLDDDPVFNRMITAVLKRFGVVCHVFQSIDKLLARLQEEKPRLLLLDLNLESKNDGFGILHLIRSDPANTFPVVIISGEDARSAVAHALEIGASDYLIKPLQRELLASRLLRHFDAAELQHAQPSEPDLQFEQDMRVEFDVRVTGVEEGRIRFWSPHLIAKGTVFQLSGPIIEEIGGAGQCLLLTVCASWAHEDGFTSEAEPDLANQDIVRNFRTWIVKNQPQ